MSIQKNTLKLWHDPRTRSFRILWLLEELGLSYELHRVTFKRPTDIFFQQDTPTGKLPTLQDGELVMFESGAIAEYLQETYGEGRLAPAENSPKRACYLQWLHFAESTLLCAISIVYWLVRYPESKSEYQMLVADARNRARSALDYLEKSLIEDHWLLGDKFSCADIMVGFSLVVAERHKLLAAEHSLTKRYLERLRSREGFQAALRAQEMESS